MQNNQSFAKLRCSVIFITVHNELKHGKKLLLVSEVLVILFMQLTKHIFGNSTVFENRALLLKICID